MNPIRIDVDRARRDAPDHEMSYRRAGGSEELGFARTLLRHGAAISRAQGCTHAVLAPTPGTIAFYERLGFVLERSLTDRWFYLP